jgi:hypothetical protein
MPHKATLCLRKATRRRRKATPKATLSLTRRRFFRARQHFRPPGAPFLLWTV